MSQIAKCSVILAVMIAAPVYAYERHLSSDSIRTAYFLGAEKNKPTADFLSLYSHGLPMPKTGPHVASIGLETPYVQVVERSEAANYSAQDAEQEFFRKPAAIRVQIQIDLTATYIAFPGASFGSPNPIPDDFWRAFKFQLLQNGAAIPAESRQAQPIYFGEDSTLSGAIVELKYDARQVLSMGVVVRVLTPDGQDIQTGFDLTRLR